MSEWILQDEDGRLGSNLLRQEILRCGLGAELHARLNPVVVRLAYGRRAMLTSWLDHVSQIKDAIDLAA